MTARQGYHTMKVLAYLHAYEGHGREAGAETTIANLLESLVSRGWEAEVLLTDKKVDPYELRGVKVRPEDDREDLIRSVKNATILLSHLECSERAALVSRRFRIPMVHLVHNTFWQTEGYLAEGCDLAVYNSEWVARHHDSSYKSEITMLAHRKGDGVAITFQPRKSAKWPGVVVHPQIDPEYYATDGPHGCITMINLHENKGPEVFWHLAKKFPRKKFIAVKGGYGVQEIPEVVPPNVRILSNTPHIRNVYANTRVLLMPSKYESFGRVAIEAAASGIPTIATPTPGLRESLGRDALFVDQDNLSGWEMALKSLNSKKTYQHYSDYYRLRSEWWYLQKRKETDDFIREIEKIAERRILWRS